MTAPIQPTESRNRAVTTGIVVLAVMLAALVALILWLAFGRGTRTAEPMPTTATSVAPSPSVTLQPSEAPPSPVETEPAPADVPPPSEPEPADTPESPVSEPVEPADPGDGQPDETAPPAQQPQQPADPGRSAKPDKPAEPERTAKPDKPAKPEKTPKPDNPNKPVQPGKPKATRAPIRMHNSGTATFTNFTVTVAPEQGPTTDKYFAVPVKVCVTKSLEDAGPGLTMVSVDPWTIEASNGKVNKAKKNGEFEPNFPKSKAVRAGECVSGNLTFDLFKDKDITSTVLRYQNGLGDVAEWSSD